MGNTRKRHGPATAGVAPEAADGRRPNIRLTCMVAGHDGEYVEYKGGGWTFRHRRLAEEAMTVRSTMALLAERLAGWYLLDDQGREIPYRPLLPRKPAPKTVADVVPGPEAEPEADDEGKAGGGQRVNPTFLDLVPPDVGQWLVGTLYEAYALAAMPRPN